MSEFEVLVIPLSLILGLGVTSILAGLTDLIRSREQTTLHWVAISWAVSILLYCVGYFNVLYGTSTQSGAWTWIRYGPVLLQTMLMFLAAGLVFPRAAGDQVPNLLADFRKHGRLSLIPLGLLLATASYFNVLTGGVWLQPANYLNVTATILIATCFVNVRRGTAAISTTLFGVLTIVGWMFVWNQPGD